MTKESTYELQCIDCNCNDCKHLTRLLDKQNKILADDKISDEETFYLVKDKKAKDIQDSIDSLFRNKDVIKNTERKIEKLKNSLQVLRKEKYGYQGSRCPIQYGICNHFNKEITFIPNVLQLHTQNCFKHRKEEI